MDLRVYDCKSRKLLLTSSSSHDGAVKDVAMRGDFVLSASKDRTARVEKKQSSLERFALCEGHSDSVEAIASDGQSTMQFVTAGWDKTLRQLERRTMTRASDRNVRRRTRRERAYRVA